METVVLCGPGFALPDTFCIYALGDSEIQRSRPSKDCHIPTHLMPRGLKKTIIASDQIMCWKQPNLPPEIKCILLAFAILEDDCMSFWAASIQYPEVAPAA